jgi:hypothetical protein
MTAGEFTSTHIPDYGNRLSRGTTLVDGTPKAWLTSPAPPAELQDSTALVEMEAQQGGAHHGVQTPGEAAELPGSSPERDGLVILPYGVLGSRR